MNTPRAANPFGTFVKFSGLAAIAAFAVLGCGRPPADQSASQDRARALERRCVQLEQDYRTVAQARDKARHELGESQTLLANQVKDLGDLRRRLAGALADTELTRKALVQRTLERDNVRVELASRMSERELLTARCDKLRKGLASLLQDDGSIPGGASAPAAGPALGSE